MVVRRQTVAVSVLWVALAFPADAQEAALQDVAAVRGCLQAEGLNAVAGCAGRLLEACQSSTADGQTTLGIVNCAGRETAAWDVLLNEEYQATRAWAEDADAVEAASAPQFGRSAEALLEAQRAWIAFRDAECGLAYALWGSGSMRTIAGANCLLSMTAERTVMLRAMREAF
jgi:uncharacterized protein YecT (DUF1311 family)